MLLSLDKCRPHWEPSVSSHNACFSTRFAHFFLLLSVWILAEAYNQFLFRTIEEKTKSREKKMLEC